MKDKRRRISKFYSQHRAIFGNYTCNHCDTPIGGYSVYDREVFALGDHLEIERRHASPDCPDAYYTGN